MRIACGVIGKKVIKVIITARKRAAVCEYIACQFTKGAIVRQERHANSNKKLLQHAGFAQDCVSHLAERMIVLIGRHATIALHRFGVSQKLTRLPPLKGRYCLDCRCHCFSPVYLFALYYTIFYFYFSFTVLQRK
jgi:hypothetical protein